MDEQSLLEEVRACRICEGHLPKEPRPILQFDPKAQILIAGQAPGIKAHDSAIPFNDVSGDRLRKWLGVSKAEFYDSTKFAILPMGFCYPGTGTSGDLPPRPECADAWREKFLALLRLRLIVVIGKYAQEYHLNSKSKSVTEIVSHWKDFLPACIPLPHPSPRNRHWITNNPWFETELLPELQRLVSQILNGS